MADLKITGEKDDIEKELDSKAAASESLHQAKESVKKQALRIAEKVKAREALSKSELAFIDDLRAIKEEKAFKEAAVRGEAREAMRELLKEKASSDNSFELEHVYEEIQAALQDLRQNVDKDVSGKLGGVISEEFGYSFEFQETTKADEFLDMLRAIRKLHNDGKTSPETLTTDDWKLAGHDGEYIFDTAELKEINAFYEYVIETNKFTKIERILTNCKNGGDFVRYMLNSKEVAKDSENDIAGVTLVPTETSGISNIEKVSGKNDALDILITGERTWGKEQFRKVLLDRVDGKDNAEKIKNAYKNVTGEEFPADFATNHEAAVKKFQEALQMKVDLLVQLAKTNLVLDKKSVNGTSGLAVVLSGDFSSKVKSLAEELKSKLDGKELPNISPEERSNMIRTAVKYGLPILVSILTQGMGIASYDSREVASSSDFDSLAKQYGENASVGMILHDVFLGKKFSLRFGENHAIENYVEEVKEFLATFDAVAAFNFAPDVIENTKPEKYKDILTRAAAQYTTLSANVGEDKAKLILRESLFKTVNLQAASVANPEDWSFRLSPLFIGVAREGVKVNSTFSRNTELSAKLGKEKKLSAKDFEAQGIRFGVKKDNEGTNWYVYDIAKNNFVVNELKDTDSLKTGHAENGNIQITSKTPLSFAIAETSLPSGKVERTLNIAQAAAKTGENTLSGNNLSTGPNLKNDADIIGAVTEAFKEFRSVDRYGQFPKVQYAIANALSGKSTDFTELKKYIANPKLAQKMGQLMQSASCLSNDKKAMLYSAMLAEMAGDHRIRDLSKKDMPKGKTLAALRGDAWGHPDAFNRRLLEVGAKDRGNLDTQRETLSDEVEKLSSLKGAKSYPGVLSFTNFSQIWTDSEGKKHKGFQGVPYTGTEIKLVGEPKTLTAPAMRATFVDRLPAGVLDTFVADIKAKKNVELTPSQVKELLKNPDAKIADVQISAQFKLGFFEKCLNDVYFFDKISYCGGGSGECVADISGAPTGDISTREEGMDITPEEATIAAGINPAAVIAREYINSKHTDNPPNNPPGGAAQETFAGQTKLPTPTPATAGGGGAPTIVTGGRG